MKIKALGMLSGGLDSTLATKVLLDLGLEVEGVNFSTGFCVTEHTRNFKNENDKPLCTQVCRDKGARAASERDLEFIHYNPKK